MKGDQDFHTLNASKMYDVHPADVTPQQRAEAKRFMYGAMYSQFGPIKLKSTILTQQ